ncbi:hypothetical protein NQK81_21385 [Amycolatopsis roodepoortensis]|uniref:hypothetical protein n=1 Tax=Amycolatopsis roodepoortensis TaxID=700274 RepID=UPI00214ADC73|nr:hypothetical protein [Amycolatopsis roodepoortensis]UUV35883.1 hypothetical protein NQK81_21385 [Amycolatopsis roodepoortensis]
MTEVLAAVSRGGPVAVRGYTERIVRDFGSMEAFLCDLQRRWFTAFDARLDAVLEGLPGDPLRELVTLSRELEGALPHVAAVLDAYAGHPALKAGEMRHAHALLQATGIEYHLVVAERSRIPRPRRGGGKTRARRRAFLVVPPTENGT